MSESLQTEHFEGGPTPEQRRYLEQLTPVHIRINNSMPFMRSITDNILMQERFRPPYKQPIARLCQYLDSLQATCLQASYSMERIYLFCSADEDAPTFTNFGFHVEHYLYDFLTRVKTTTDLLALIIKHIFE